MGEFSGVTLFVGLEYSASLFDVVYLEGTQYPHFEDVEKFADFLKSLLVGTLLGWSRIWGFVQCISVFDFMKSVFVSI